MIDFLNRNIHDPVARLIDENPGTAIGVGSLGLLGLGYLLRRQKKMRETADKHEESYMRRHGKIKPAELKKLKELSKSKAVADYITPGQLESVMGDRNNAYWFPPMYADALKDDPRLPSNKNTDGKYGHIYYTDGTASLPVLAHEYGHAAEWKDFKPAIPEKHRFLFAGAGGLATSLALRALGLKHIPAALLGTTAAAGLGFVLNTPEVENERRAEARAGKYLKSLRGSDRRLKDGIESGKQALATYENHRTSAVIKPFLTSLAATGIIGGGLALINKNREGSIA